MGGFARVKNEEPRKVEKEWTYYSGFMVVVVSVCCESVR